MGDERRPRSHALAFEALYGLVPDLGSKLPLLPLFTATPLSVFRSSTVCNPLMP